MYFVFFVFVFFLNRTPTGEPNVNATDAKRDQNEQWIDHCMEMVFHSFQGNVIVIDVA